MRGAWQRFIVDVPVRERWLVVGAMALSAALVLIYVLATRSREIAGDEVIYNEYGVFFTEGSLWHTTTPFGIEHASAWKPPGYPAWVGFWYSVLGVSPLRVEVVQGLLLAPLTVLLSWRLARRLLGAQVAIVAAFIVAAFPLVWEYFGMLFPEALAIPLTLATLLAVWGRPATPANAVLAGVLLGLGLLIRPTAFFLVAAVAVAWILAAGWRRGLGMSALAVVVAGLVVLPWTVRNFVVLDGFVPISVQESGAYGTFNEEAANDPDAPYSWRPLPEPYLPAINEFREEGLDEPALRSELYDLAWDYVRDNPEAVPKAFFYNGLLRFWEIRSPGAALDEVDFQGRSRAVRAVGLAMYYALVPLAIYGLWRLRRRRDIVLPLLALAITASLAFTLIAGTRYRAPVEPLIVIVAAAGLVSIFRRDAPLEPRPPVAAPGGP